MCYIVGFYHSSGLNRNTNTELVPPTLTERNDTIIKQQKYSFTSTTNQISRFKYKKMYRQVFTDTYNNRY